MKLQLQKMKFTNIRDFHKLDVDLQSSENDHIHLLQMPNGTGKTTTMRLLRAALSGTLTEPPRKFRPTRFAADHGKFELTVAVDGKSYTVILELDYENDTHEFFTAAVARVGGGKNAGHQLPRGAKHVLTPEFTNLFVFDGELGRTILDRTETKAEDAIKAIYRLDRLERDIRVGIDEEVEAKREKAEKSGVQTDQGLKARRTEQRNLKRHLSNELEPAEKEYSSNLEKMRGDIASKKGQYDALIKGNQEVAKENAEVDEGLKAKKGEVTRASVDLMREMAAPGRYSAKSFLRMKKLAESMTVLKLPRTTAREFFKELASGDECVCGTPIDEEMRVRIIQTSEKYLGAERVQVMNHIKAEVRDLEEFHGCKELIEHIQSLEGEAAILRQRKIELVDIMSEEDQAEAHGLDEAISNLKMAIRDAEQEYDALTTKDPSLQKDWGLDERTNIPLCELRILQLDGVIDEATDTVSFQDKAKLLRKILDAVVARSVGVIKKQVQGETNEALAKVLGLEQLVTIKEINRAIILEEKDDVSEGQKLSLAYCFLATLFGRGPIEVPFVVDSPAGSLDNDVRSEIGKMIPALFQQMVIFVISSEKPYFVTALQKNYDGIEYTTIHKNPNDPKKTDIERGREYFESFQSDEEVTSK